MASTVSPDMIGPYRIEDRLGTGGMGEVYRGYDSRLDRPIALKHIRAEMSSESARERFQREAKAVARLSHPAIVQVHDWVESDNGGWIVMELVDGQPLTRVLRDGPLEPARAVRVVRQILGGLAVSHAAGIIHRDLKAENIMITAMEQVKILDFGLAKRLHSSDESQSALTVVGKLLGTVSAMSPEQALGDFVDHRSDLFSLGSLLYEMLSGVVPFKSENQVQTLTRICTLRHKPLLQLRPEIPPMLSDLVDLLLEKDPADRPQSAAEVMAALDAPLSAPKSTGGDTKSEDIDPLVPAALNSKIRQEVASSSSLGPMVSPGQSPISPLGVPVVPTQPTGSSPVVSPPLVSPPVVSPPVVSQSAVSPPVVSPPAASPPAASPPAASGAIPPPPPPPPVGLPPLASISVTGPDSIAEGIPIAGAVTREITVTPSQILGAAEVQGVIGAANVNPLVPIQITFRQEEDGAKTLEVENRRHSILDCALAGEIALFHECGGRARCSTCRVRVREGLENLQPRTPHEAKLAERLGWEDDIRLACQTRMNGDVEVERLVRDTQDIGFLLGEQVQTIPAQEKALALMSCELLDFEGFAGKSPPYDQIHLLHRFLLQIGDLVPAYGGRIQSHSGAGFRAFFGLNGGSAGEKCLAAVRASLRAADRMLAFNRYANTYFSNEFQFGIGLHFARMVVGQAGNPSNKPLLAIGDAGPLVDSLAGHNSVVGTSILATEEMINIIEHELDIGDILPEEQVGSRSVTLYEVCDLADPDPAFVVQTTFERLSAWSEESSKVFYKTLFELDPSSRELFEHIDMRTQGQKFMNMLTTAVAGVDQLEALTPALRDLGERHIEYGVEYRHYDVVGRALLLTVEQMIGTRLDFHIRQAWEQFYQQIVEVMTE